MLPDCRMFLCLKETSSYANASQLMFLNCNIAFSSMPVFLPTVLHDMGYSSLSSQALSAPPFFFAFIVLLLTAHFSDRLAARSPFVILHALLAFGGYAAIALGGLYEWAALVRYIAIYPACAGFFSAITIIITWTINNQQSKEGKGTGMTILNIVGQCGPLIGTRLYPDSDAPYFVRGMTVCALAMALVCVLAIVLRIVLVRENRKRAKEYSLAHDFQDDEDSDIRPKQDELGDEHFMMML
jgi:MFS family permease